MTPEEMYRQFRANGGSDAQRLGWHNAQTQRDYLRTTLMLLKALVPLQDVKIHDAGCGYGDLWPYLRAEGVAPENYLGTDYMEESLAVARARFPELTFKRLDLMRDSLPKADVTFAVGTFAFYKSNEIERLLSRMWHASAKGLAFNVWWNLTPDYLMYLDSKKTEQIVLDFLNGNAKELATSLSTTPGQDSFFAATK